MQRSPPRRGLFDFDQARQHCHAALKTQEASGLTSTCARWTNLAGALVLIPLGAPRRSAP